jgi:hypothetical protein
MVRKKTNYERKGLVRQIAGAVFSPPKASKASNDLKWRPRKKLFAKLDGKVETVAQQDEMIQTAFSVESDTAEYRRENLFERKKVAFKQAEKRDLGNITIKPSDRDNTKSRGFAGENKRRNVAGKSKYSADPFENSSFVLKGPSSDDSVQTSSTKHTSSSKNAEIKTVNSDPSDFFSKTPAKLTAKNLEAMSNDVSEIVGIENRNPRSEFHQFTIDDDKESTVILSVDYPGESSIVDSEDKLVDDESKESTGVTSKGTQIQKRCADPTDERRRDSFEEEPQHLFPHEKGSDESFDFFGVAKPQKEQEISFKTDDFRHFQRQEKAPSSNVSRDADFPFEHRSETQVETRDSLVDRLRGNPLARNGQTYPNHEDIGENQGILSSRKRAINTKPSVQDPSTRSLNYSPSPGVRPSSDAKQRQKTQHSSKSAEPEESRQPLRSSTFMNLPVSSNQQVAKKMKLDPPPASKRGHSPFQDPEAPFSGHPGKEVKSSNETFAVFFEDSTPFRETGFKSIDPSEDAEVVFTAFEEKESIENQSGTFTRTIAFRDPPTKPTEATEEDAAFDGIPKPKLFEVSNADDFFGTPTKPQNRFELSPRRPKSSQKSKTKVMVPSRGASTVVPDSTGVPVDPFDTSRTLFDTEPMSAATKVAQKPKSKYPMFLDVSDENSFSGTPYMSKDPFDTEPRPRNQDKSSSKVTQQPESKRPTLREVPDEKYFSEIPTEPVDPFDPNFSTVFETTKTPPRNKTRKPKPRSNQKSAVKQTAIAVPGEQTLSDNTVGHANHFDTNFVVFDAPRTPARDQREAAPLKPNSSQKSASKQIAGGFVDAPKTFPNAQADPFDTRFAVFDASQAPPRDQTRKMAPVKPKSSQKSKNWNGRTHQTSERPDDPAKSSEPFGEPFAAFDMPSQAISAPKSKDTNGYTRQQAKDSVVPEPSSAQRIDRSDREVEGFVDFSRPKTQTETNKKAFDSGHKDVQVLFDVPHTKSSPRLQETKQSLDSAARGDPVDSQGFFDVPQSPSREETNMQSKIEDSSPADSKGPFDTSFSMFEGSLTLAQPPSPSQTKNSEKPKRWKEVPIDNNGDNAVSIATTSTDPFHKPGTMEFQPQPSRKGGNRGRTHLPSSYDQPRSKTSSKSFLNTFAGQTGAHGTASMSPADYTSPDGQTSVASSSYVSSQKSQNNQDPFVADGQASAASSDMPSQKSYGETSTTSSYVPSQTSYGYQGSCDAGEYNSTSSCYLPSQVSHSDQGSYGTAEDRISASLSYMSSSQKSRNDQSSHGVSKDSLDINGRDTASFHRAKNIFENGASSHAREPPTRAPSNDSSRSRAKWGRNHIDKGSRSNQGEERQHGENRISETLPLQTKRSERQAHGVKRGGYLRQDIVQKGNFFPRQGAWTERVLPKNGAILEPTTSSDSEETISSTEYTNSNIGSNTSEKPMGIASFSAILQGSASIHSGGNAPTLSYHSRSTELCSHGGNAPTLSYHSRSTELCSHGKPKTLCTHVDDSEENSHRSKTSSSGSFGKATGLPNNAIVASMLFRTHHNIDTSAVEARIKAREEEENKMNSNRGDFPHAIHAMEAVSCVSSFSEDTGALQEAWRKPTSDLLDYFAASRRTDFDAKKYLKQQRQNTAALFEA